LWSIKSKIKDTLIDIPFGNSISLESLNGSSDLDFTLIGDFFIGRIKSKTSASLDEADKLMGKVDLNGCNCIKGVIINKDSKNRRGYFKLRRFDDSFGRKHKYCLGIMLTKDERYEEHCYADTNNKLGITLKNANSIQYAKLGQISFGAYSRADNFNSNAYDKTAHIPKAETLEIKLNNSAYEPMVLKWERNNTSVLKITKTTKNQDFKSCSVLNLKPKCRPVIMDAMFSQTISSLDNTFTRLYFTLDEFKVYIVVQSQYGTIYEGNIMLHASFSFIRVDKIIHTKTIDNYLKDDMYWTESKKEALIKPFDITLMDDPYVLDAFLQDSNYKKTKFYTYKTGNLFIGAIGFQDEEITDDELYELDTKDKLISQNNLKSNIEPIKNYQRLTDATLKLRTSFLTRVFIDTKNKIVY